MHCRKCGYLLFNLPQPVCPECGTAFQVAAYQFQPRDVSFHCPHCDRAYKGSDQDEWGLPEPRAFECAGCGRPIDVNQMRVVPRHDEAIGLHGGRTPWERRHRLGVLRAWWSSLIQIVFKPERFFRQLRFGAWHDAVLFIIMTFYIVMLPLVCIHAGMLWLMPVGPAAVPAPAGRFGSIRTDAVVFVLGYGAMAPILHAFMVCLALACSIHLALTMLAHDRRPFGYTYRVVLFGSAPAALLLAPLLCTLVAWFWALTVIVVGIREVHRTTTARACVAVFWPVVLIIVLLEFWMMAFPLPFTGRPNLF